MAANNAVGVQCTHGGLLRYYIVDRTIDNNNTRDLILLN